MRTFGTPRPLGLATATTSATFFPQFEHYIRAVRVASVAERPAILASASGSMCRDASHGQVTRRLMWGSMRTGRGAQGRGGRLCSAVCLRMLYVGGAASQSRPCST